MSNDTVKVTARCVGCGKRREIGPGEIPVDEVPMCDSCYMPMVAESAVCESGSDEG